MTYTVRSEVYSFIHAARRLDREEAESGELIQARFLAALEGLSYLCYACEAIRKAELVDPEPDVGDAPAEILAQVFSFAKDIEQALRDKRLSMRSGIVRGFRVRYLELYDLLMFHRKELDRLAWQHELDDDSDAALRPPYARLGTDLAVEALNRLISILKRETTSETRQLRGGAMA